MLGEGDHMVREAGTATSSTESLFSPVEGMNVWEALVAGADRLPDKTAVIEGDHRWTFAQIRDRARLLSHHLAEVGLRKGDVAGLYLRNSIDLITVFYALQRLGVIVAWINPDYREHELRHIVNDSGARALFLMDEWEGFRHLDLVLSLRKDLPRLEQLIVVPSSEAASVPTGDGLHSLDALLTDSASPAESPAVSPQDLSMLLYTSGTTGAPKGAMIKQFQTLRAGLAYSYGIQSNEDDIFIAFLSLSHSYGCGALLVGAVVLGATIVLMDRYSTAKAFELIERERVTLQLASPAHYIMQLRHPKRGDYDLSSLRAGLIAGQIAPPGLITQAEEQMGIYLTSFLGASEVGPGLSIMLPPGSSLAVREQYIGYPIEGTALKVVDPVTNQEVPPGEPGELLLSGWHVMAGYWENPEGTARQLRDGWLYTGDLVQREENGLVQILGRLKDAINRGGFKIIPSELEALLLEHPDIEEVCVVGTANPVLGESICVCVTPGVDGCVALEEVRQFLAGKVADNKLPDELLVLENFPRLSGGLKVNRYGKGGLTELAATATTKQSVR